MAGSVAAACLVAERAAASAGSGWSSASAAAHPVRWLVDSPLRHVGAGGLDGYAGSVLDRLLGVSFGYARHLRGSLWVPIGMHALNNAIASYEVVKFIGASPA